MRIGSAFDLCATKKTLGMAVVGGLTLLSLALGGCATNQYGNFIPTAVDQRQLAHEAVQQLITIWPPAKTRLEFKQPTPDIFGQTLVRELREQGYAVLEYSPANPTIGSTESYPLSYLLDQSDNSLIRLMLFIGDQSIGRMYEGTAPVGNWVKRE